MKPATHPPLTKIVATLGPASSDVETITALVEAGVSVFRFNFSHGTMADHAERLAIVRATAKATGQPVAVLGDLPGPKIRVGEVVDGGIELTRGTTVYFQREAIVAEPPATAGDPVVFSCTYLGLVDDLKPGDRLLVNDGAIRMLVIEHGGDHLACTVTDGGLISSGKGINLPDSDFSGDVITPRDWTFVEWAVANGLDFIALSFVRDRGEVYTLRDGIDREARKQGIERFRLPIVAKIEQRGAVENIERIVDAADAVMVARGDLGVEMDLARVPVIQKQVIAAARAAGKSCIVATQMLETMIDNPIPTRAEASDVANAIFEEVDAVMLSGETAVGAYPVLTVDTMRRIAEASEAYLAAGERRSTPPRKLQESKDPVAALAHGVWTVANDTGSEFVVIWSQSGGGARLLSQNAFRIPIKAVSSDRRALRRMQLYRGVHPIEMPVPRDLSAFTNGIERILLERDWARLGARCVLVSGWPLGVSKVSNSIAIHDVGNPDTGFAWHRLEA